MHCLKKIAIVLTFFALCAQAMEIEKPETGKGEEEKKPTVEVKEVTVDTIDIEKEEDIIQHASFAELLEERNKEGLPLIVAQLTTEINGTFVYNYLELYQLISSLFQNNWVSLVDLTNKKNPLNQQPILMIKFYEIWNIKDPNFNFVGSHYDVGLTTERGKFFKRYIQSNWPTIFIGQAPQILAARAQEQFNLGLYYYKKKDYSKARKYYEQAAQQDLKPNVKAGAQLNLGEMYYFGLEKDYSKAREYYEQVAQQNVDLRSKARAQENLGEIYCLGQGIEKDYSKAREYYEQAAQQNVNPDAKVGAQEGLANIYYFGKGVEKDYSKAREYYEQVAHQNVNPHAKVRAQLHLGDLYFFGNGVEKDYSKAREYYEQAAQQDLLPRVKADAQGHLGIIYFEQKDYEKSREYLEQVAQQNIHLEAKERAERNLEILKKEIREATATTEEPAAKRLKKEEK